MAFIAPTTTPDVLMLWAETHVEIDDDVLRPYVTQDDFDRAGAGSVWSHG